MKTCTSCTFITLALLSIFNLQPLIVHAQGTAFTYQGRLNANGAPASGIYNLTFTLFANSTGGTAVAGPVTNSAVATTNGLFTVTMDFGSSVWNGATNWLEIAVETNGGSGFTTLAPRQLLTPTPYAIFAEGVNAAGISGIVPAGSISGFYTNAVSITNNGNSFTGNGSGLTGVNAGALNGLGASNFWQTAGNNGTTPGANFVGTKDNQPLELRANGLRALRLEPNTNGAPNVIGGSPLNYVSNGVFGATIAGGGATNYGGVAYSNSVTTIFGTIGGGFQNQVGGLYAATVSGGFLNSANGAGSFIGGGALNLATAGGATIGGGQNNTNSAAGATIAGGEFNSASGPGAFIGGGGFDGANWMGNRASGNASVIGGGIANQVTNAYSAIGGGTNNISSGLASTIGGGSQNAAGGDYGSVGGGIENSSSGSESAVGGGRLNSASSYNTFVGGGYLNSASGLSAAIGGGDLNNAGGYYSSIGGGYNNLTGGTFLGGAVVAGGYANHATVDVSTVAGGYNNVASGYGASIGGGGYDGGTAGGNTASGNASVIGGGLANQATNSDATVGGGQNNTAGGANSTVAGGSQNIASGTASTVIGGHNNTASATDSTVLGGDNNSATGFAAIAAGEAAQALHQGAFVWSDSSGGTYSSDRNNQFKLRAAGGMVLDVSGSSGLNPAALLVNSTSGNGVGIYVAQTSSDATAVFAAAGTGDIIKGFNADNNGVPVFEVVNSGATYATSFNSTSDRNAKENFTTINSAAVLAKVASLPISEWNFKSDPAGQRHLGPMAQDFHAVFGLNGHDDKHISVVDESGVALAAIQGLNQKLEEKDAEIQQLQRSVGELRTLISQLAKNQPKEAQSISSHISQP